VILADRIAFARYDDKSRNWILRGPYDLNRETVLKLVEAIRGLRRKKLAVDELLRDFRPGTDITSKLIRILYGKVVKPRSPKTEALFADWKRLFSQVCAYSPEKLEGIEVDYNLTGSIDYSALLFAVHTYYALLMKLLAAEVAYLFGAGRWLKSYIAELEDANMKGLDTFRRTLEDLESGGVFRRLLNITNFIEGDYFSWYLEELDTETANAIADLAKRLADYEPATPVLEPEYTRDLLKRLYQNLLPKKIRHDLGEYYTPDWLADLLLDETELTIGNFNRMASEKKDMTVPLCLRILDPACGSGTFLVLFIKRLREYAEEHYLKDILSNYLLKNIVGFDLNPLAVLTARTNFLLAIADLLTYAKGPIEIPIYLADSIMVETRTTLTGTSYAVRTYVGLFELPKTLVDKGALGKLLETLDRYVRLKYSPKDFGEAIKGELELSEEELGLAKKLYKTFSKLEDEGKNHVWTSIIKNAFAPLTIVNSYGKFDHVVGNPPWINWESLPESYRDETKRLWDQYGLLTKTKGMGLGKTKRDMAMLFVTRCLDRYVKDEGSLSLLIPFTTYKTQAGAGFRNYLANKCNVLKIHDLVELFPFEGAINRTSLIVIEKKGKTSFPISCTMWVNPRSAGIDQNAALEEAYSTTRQYAMILAPITKGKPESSWMIVSGKSYDALQKVMRASEYRAYAGVFTGINSVYFVDIVEKQASRLMIKNLEAVGKKEVASITTLVEPHLIYPLLRGRDHKKWYVKPSTHILIPTTSKGDTIPTSKLRVEYPETYQYLLNFLDDLVNRKAEPYRTKLEPYRKRSLNEAEKLAPPFYWLFNAEPALAPYKVMWKYISGKISGKGEFSVAVAEPHHDRDLGKKTMIPNEKLMLVPFREKEEAHYVASVLNSSIAQLIVMSYTIETAISTHVLKNVYVPQFDPHDRRHLDLADASKKAHELAEKYFDQNDLSAQEELTKLEEEIDKKVAQLYGMTNVELEEIKSSLAIFRGEDIEQEAVEETPIEASVDFLNAVTSPGTPGSFEVAINNPKKETLLINIRLPNRSVDLKTDKEKDNIRVEVPPLPIGEYEIPYKIVANGKVTVGKFKLHVRATRKFRSGKGLVSKLDELSGGKQ
jgi:methylase of polypeptide subunit release factors